MVRLLLRLLVGMAGLWLADQFVAGIRVETWQTLLIAALLLGIVNAVVRPILVVLSLPFILVTLGLFLLVINAAMLGLVSMFLGGFHVDGFWSAILGSIIVSITVWVGSVIIGPKPRERG